MSPRAAKKRVRPAERKVFRRFKVEQLPPDAQAVVFEGLARGESYPAIRRQLARLGHRVSRDALMRFRHGAYRAQHNRLKRVRANMTLFKEVLGLNSQSPSVEIAEEMLYTAACNGLSERETAHLLAVLREAREQRKAGRGGSTLSSPRSRAESKRRSGKSLKQHLDQLYGPGVVVEEEVDGSDPDNETR